MAILNITTEQKDELDELLSPTAAQWLGRDKVFTLAEYGAFRHYEGVIQFTVREEKKPVGELLYLYVTPTCRETGVAAQLLMAMEEVLFQSGISEAEVVLSAENSALGEFLEGYGFAFGESGTEWLTFPSFPSDSDAVKKAIKKVVPLKDLTAQEQHGIEERLKAEKRSFLYSDLDEGLSCIYRDSKQGDGVIYVAKREGYPTILGISAAGENGDAISALLVCCVISGLRRYAPKGMYLAVSDKQVSALFHDQFESYLYAENTLKGTLLVEEPERESGAEDEMESEEDMYFG